MQAYISDIRLGVLTFPFIALVVVLPYALYQYRRFGAINFWKTFVVFAFIFYCLCVMYLVALPLPANRSILVPGAQTPQLRPFYALAQIRASTDLSFTDPSTWIPSLRNPLSYHVLFNIVMTVPLGFFLRYLFRMRWWLALMVGFLSSLLFETSQITGLFGIYEHPYRLFDVDDIICNTTGVMLGFWLGIPLCYLLPDMRKIEQASRLKGEARVSVTRRAVAFVVDIVIVCALFFIGQFVFGILGKSTLSEAGGITHDAISAAAEAGKGDSGAAVSETSATIASVWSWARQTLRLAFEDPLQALLFLTVVFFILFAIVPVVTRGRTLGQALVGLKIVTYKGNRPAWYKYFLRYGTLWALVVLPALALLFFPGTDVEGIRLVTFAELIGMVYAVWFMTLLARAIWAALGHHLVLLSDVVSQTMLVPSKQAKSSLQGSDFDTQPLGNH